MILGCRLGSTLTAFATDHSGSSSAAPLPLITIASAAVIDDKGALTGDDAERYLRSGLADSPESSPSLDGWAECERTATYRRLGDLYTSDLRAILLRRGVSALRQRSAAPFDIAISSRPTTGLRARIELARCAAITGARHAILVNEGVAARRVARLPTGPAAIAMMEDDALTLLSVTEAGSTERQLRFPDLGAGRLRQALAGALLGGQSNTTHGRLSAAECDRLGSAAIETIKAGGTKLYVALAEERPLHLLLQPALATTPLQVVCDAVMQAIRGFERIPHKPAPLGFAAFGAIAEWVPLLPPAERARWHDIRLVPGAISTKLAEGAVLHARALQAEGSPWPQPETDSLRLSCFSGKGASVEVALAGRPLPLSEAIVLGADADPHGIYRFRLRLQGEATEPTLIETEFSAGPLASGERTARFELTIGMGADFDPMITRVATAEGRAVPCGRSYGAVGERLRISPSELRAIEIV